MKTIRVLFFLGISLCLSVLCMSFAKVDKVLETNWSSMAALPDLKLISVGVGGNSPCGGNSNMVKVMIQNGGSGPTKGRTEVRIRMVPLDSMLVKIISSKINPNEFKTITFNGVNFKQGDNRVTAVVNPTKSMQEITYNNNEKIISVKAYQLCN